VTDGGSDHLGLLAVAIACLIPALPAGWKAASLRGDIFNKWSERVDLAHAGLTERIKDELLSLQAEIDRALGGAGADLPAQVVADPGPLVASANRCAELLHTRDRLRGRFRRHRRMGPILIGVVVIYVVGWVLATAHYTDIVRSKWVGITGLAIAGTAIGLAIIVFLAYAYFESKLAIAEEWSTPDGR
jgi:hypothetical protein